MAFWILLLSWGRLREFQIDEVFIRLAMSYTPHNCKQAVCASAKWCHLEKLPNLEINIWAAILQQVLHSQYTHENRKWKATATIGAVASLKYMSYIKQMCVRVCVLYINVHGNWGLLLPRLHLSRSKRRRRKQVCLHRCDQQDVPSGQQKLIASSVMGTN